MRNESNAKELIRIAEEVGALAFCDHLKCTGPEIRELKIDKKEHRIQ